MTWVLALCGAALCGAACVSNDIRVYLWIPGIILLVGAFSRATAPKPVRRPGYLHDHKDPR